MPLPKRAGPDPYQEQEAEFVSYSEQLASQKAFHFSKNARSFTDLFSDHFLTINKGIVGSPTRTISFEKFDRYFKKYLKMMLKKNLILIKIYYGHYFLILKMISKDKLEI